MTEKILIGDVVDMLRELPDASVDCAVTSPPYYGLRDYGVPGQIGLEETPGAYVERLVSAFREVRRALRPDGTLWLNLGDCYIGKRTSTIHHRNIGLGGGASTQDAAGLRPDKKPSGFLKPKDLIGIPWRVALALQEDGWWLRDCIIWHKPNPMPESVTDRTTKAHEYVFMLAKSQRYFYDREAIKEPCSSGPSDVRKMLEGRDRIGGKTLAATDPRYAANNQTRVGRRRAVGSPDGRNARSVWTITTRPYKGAHFAVFPERLVEPCVLAGSRPGGTVLDPFAGSGTTLAVAKRLGRGYVGIDINPEYEALMRSRLSE